MFEIFNYGFLIRSFISLIMLSLISSLNGSYLFYKKEFKILPGLSLALFSGLVFSKLIDANYIIYSFTIALILLFVILYTRKNKRGFGIYIITFFIFSFLTTLLISLVGFYRESISFFLLGNIFTISNNEFLFLIVTTILTILVYFLFFQYLKPITFNEKIARSEGLYVTLYNYFFLLLVSINIILSFRIIGLFLILPYLILPSMISSKLVRRFDRKFYVAVGINLVISSFSFFLGISYNINFGLIIILLMMITLLFVRILKNNS